MNAIRDKNQEHKTGGSGVFGRLRKKITGVFYPVVPGAETSDIEIIAEPELVARPSSEPRQRRLSNLNEVRPVETVFGVADLEEDRDTRTLILEPLPQGEAIVPYIEDGVMCGVFVVDPWSAVPEDARRVRYAVSDTIPYFLLEDSTREAVNAALQARGVRAAIPEEFNLTTEVKHDLEHARLLFTLKPDRAFDLHAFTESIDDVKTTPQFENVYLLRTHDRSRYVMAVDRLIETVIDLHPIFMKVYQPDAVRIAFRKSLNTWIAPFRTTPQTA